MTPQQLDAWLDDPHRRPVVMGILNVTPDSFSDGGQYLGSDAAIEHSRQMVEDGADWIDIGGESTRPGSDPVPPEEQLRRVIPAIEAIAGEDVVVSIDTTSALVARAALDAGASIVNDVSAGEADENMPNVVASGRAGVLMHMRGDPKTMQMAPHYEDVVSEIETYLLDRVAALAAAGADRRRLLIDPGIGFGKTIRHNLELLAATARLASHGLPLLIGTSRKRFLGTLTGESVADRRVFGTAATVAWAITHGASVVRVHDVREMRQVVDVTLAMMRPGDVEA